ncbi:MAG: hypothetical protein E7Y34_01205 [Mycoplasma sp.]|nr:hypothetical protein [Mycoplasma sp.]
MIENKITEEFLRQLRFRKQDNNIFIYKSGNSWEIEYDPNSDGKITLIEIKDNQKLRHQDWFTANSLNLFVERYRDCFETIIVNSNTEWWKAKMFGERRKEKYDIDAEMVLHKKDLDDHLEGQYAHCYKVQQHTEAMKKDFEEVMEKHHWVLKTIDDCYDLMKSLGEFFDACDKIVFDMQKIVDYRNKKVSPTNE